MEIKLTLLPEGNYHQDLLIKIGNYEELADTYYFWRDEFGKLNDPYSGLEKVISKYLSCWGFTLEKFQLNEVTFIPINFSDEYIGGFKVICSKDYFDVVYGYIYDIQNQVVRVNDDECHTNLNDKEIDSVTEFRLDKRKFIRSLHLITDQNNV